MIVQEAVNEAKKKKKKKEEDLKQEQQNFKADPVLDYSTPQGDMNRYKRQGVSGIGPYTSENALRLFVKNAINEAMKGKKNEKKR